MMLDLDAVFLNANIVSAIVNVDAAVFSANPHG